MKIKCLFITSEYRGDHSADVYRLYEIEPDETVEKLVKRIGLKELSDSIELKIIQEVKE